MPDTYLAARTEFFALGKDAFVVVDVILPAVLGPLLRSASPCRPYPQIIDILVLVREARVIALETKLVVSRFCLAGLWNAQFLF